jgi:hypothetical protein
MTVTLAVPMVVENLLSTVVKAWWLLPFCCSRRRPRPEPVSGCWGARTGGPGQWQDDRRPPARGRIPGHRGPAEVPAMIRVVLLDDGPLVRAGLRMILQSQGTAEVVAEDGDGTRAVALVRAHRPDVLLTDIRMPVVAAWKSPAGYARWPLRPRCSC